MKKLEKPPELLKVSGGDPGICSLSPTVGWFIALSGSLTVSFVFSCVAPTAVMNGQVSGNCGTKII